MERPMKKAGNTTASGREIQNVSDAIVRSPPMRGMLAYDELLRKLAKLGEGADPKWSRAGVNTAL